MRLSKKYPENAMGRNKKINMYELNSIYITLLCLFSVNFYFAIIAWRRGIGKDSEDAGTVSFAGKREKDLTNILLYDNILGRRIKWKHRQDF